MAEEQPCLDGEGGGARGREKQRRSLRQGMPLRAIIGTDDGGVSTTSGVAYVRLM